MKPTLQQIVNKVDWCYKEIMDSTSNGAMIVGVTKKEITDRIMLLINYDSKYNQVDRMLLRRMVAWKLYV